MVKDGGPREEGENMVAFERGESRCLEWRRKRERSVRRDG